MSKLLKKYGGLILFYTIIIVGILMLNARFRYLNNQPSNSFDEIELAFQE